MLRNTRQSLITPPFPLMFILPFVVPSALVIESRVLSRDRKCKASIDYSLIYYFFNNETYWNTEKGKKYDDVLFISLRVNTDLCFYLAIQIRRLKRKDAEIYWTEKSSGWRNDESRRNKKREEKGSAFMPSGSKFARSRRRSSRLLLHLALNLHIWLPKLAWAKLIWTALSISHTVDNAPGGLGERLSYFLTFESWPNTSYERL